VLDGGELFWINEGGLEKYQPVGPAGLMRAPAGGGAVERLGDVAPDALLAADASALYFTDRGAGAVLARPRAGGETRTLASGLKDPGALLLDDANVYVLASSQVAITQVEHAKFDDGRLTPARAELADPGDGAIWRVPKRGGKPKAIVTGLPLANGAQLDGDRFYVRAFFGGQLLSAPRKGGAATLVVQEPKQWNVWRADRGDVFWSVMASEPELERLVGAHGVPLAAWPKLAGTLAAGPTHVYFTDDSGVYRVARAGGPVQLVAKMMPPGELVVAADAVYFCDLMTVGALAPPK
jgi:hypothetical protein